MKTIYYVAIATSIMCASCINQEDAEMVTPRNAQMVRSLAGSEKGPNLDPSLDGLTQTVWQVENYTVRVQEVGRPDIDSVYLPYGTYRFIGVPASGVSDGGRASGAVRTLVHAYVNLQGRPVTDSLLYYQGDYNRGMASNRCLTVWRAGAAEEGRLVYTLRQQTKSTRTYESRVTVSNGNGGERTLIRSFTLSK